MTDLTVNAKHKVDVGRDDIIVSTAQAILIICRRCGDTKNVSMHESVNLNDDLHPGTVQYPAFKFCTCYAPGNAPNAGGVLRQVRGAVTTCKSVDEACRILDHWINFEEREKR